MCTKATPPSCIEMISGPDFEKGWGICPDCFRLAEDNVIAAADAFYDIAHSTSVRLVDWKDVTKKIDKAVQILRKARQQRGT